MRGDRLLPAQVLDDDPFPVDGDADADVAGLLDALGEEVDDGDAHVPQADGLVRQGEFDGVLAVAVGDDEQPGRHRQGVSAGQSAPHLGRVGGAAPQLGGQSAGELREGGGDAPGGHRPVEPLGVQQVGQPLGPLPVAEALAGSGDGDAHVVGCVERRHLHEQGADHAQAVLAGPDDADVAHPVEGDGEREFVAGAEACRQGGRLVQHEPVGRAEHGGLRLGDPEIAYGHLPGARPGPQEVAVVAAALP